VHVPQVADQLLLPHKEPGAEGAAGEGVHQRVLPNQVDFQRAPRALGQETEVAGEGAFRRVRTSKMFHQRLKHLKVGLTDAAGVAVFQLNKPDQVGLLAA